MLGQFLVDHFSKLSTFTKLISIDIGANHRPTHENEEFVNLDITNEREVQNYFNTLAAQDEPIEEIALINCAGISVFDDYACRSKQDFMKVLEVNLYGSFNMLQKTVNFSRTKNIKCSIVNTGSLFGTRSPDERNYVDLNRKNSEVYGASKAGIEQMTRYFAAHLGKENIRVNCVSPGGILNELEPQGDAFQKLYSYKVPLGRMGLYNEMVGAYAFLLSNVDASYISGQIINVDGGYTAW